MAPPDRGGLAGRPQSPLGFRPAGSSGHPSRPVQAFSPYAPPPGTGSVNYGALPARRRSGSSVDQAAMPNFQRVQSVRGIGGMGYYTDPNMPSSSSIFAYNAPSNDGNMNDDDEPVVSPSTSRAQAIANRRPKPRTPPDCCAVCGSPSTPEWRKGPAGIRSLCNACGLTYSKRSVTFDARTNGTPSMAQIEAELVAIGAERFRVADGRWVLPEGTPLRILQTQERTRTADAARMTSVSRPRSKTKAEKDAALSLLNLSSIVDAGPSSPQSSGRRPSVDSGATSLSAGRSHRSGSLAGPSSSAMPIAPPQPQRANSYGIPIGVKSVGQFPPSYGGYMQSSQSPPSMYQQYHQPHPYYPNYSTQSYHPSSVQYATSPASSYGSSSSSGPFTYSSIRPLTPPGHRPYSNIRGAEGSRPTTPRPSSPGPLPRPASAASLSRPSLQSMALSRPNSALGHRPSSPGLPRPPSPGAYAFRSASSIGLPQSSGTPLSRPASPALMMPRPMPPGNRMSISHLTSPTSATPSSSSTLHRRSSSSLGLRR